MDRRIDPWRLRHISLKWKLLIPFLFLPTALTMFMVAWGVYSQHQILAGQEEGRMRDNFQHLQYRLRLRLESSGAMAALVAATPSVQRALAAGDRNELIRLYLPEYDKLRRLAGIKQFHFHTHPARSLLRLNSLDQYGDDLSYRQTIRKAAETGNVVTGLEVGLTGFGLRGVAPVFHEGKLVGTFEIGSSVEQPFLDEFKEDFQADLTLYLPAAEDPRGYTVLATTAGARTFLSPSAYRQTLANRRPVFFTVQAGDDDLAGLAGPVIDYRNQAVAVVEMTLNRAETLVLINRHALLLVAFGLGLLLLAFMFVWRISLAFLAPIGGLVRQAERITSGEQVPQMAVVARDEFGALAEALNRMLAKLEAQQFRLQNQAHELEARVQQRTAALVHSEEKYRTLLEHIPLVVYRMEPGMVRSFVSPYIEKLTGWPPEELVGGPAVWASLIHPRDRQRVTEAKSRALTEGLTLDMEYSLQDRHGQEVDILDHAEPIWNEDGRVVGLEGYLLDIRERRLLQDQAVKAEELKTLSEISARLAHEFRNPLVMVGLAARRLAKSLGPNDPAATYAGILTEQVEHLERILHMIQSYIKPMGLQPREVGGADFFKDVARGGAPFLAAKNIVMDLKLSGELPHIVLDPDLMGRALLNLIRNAAYQMPPRGILALRVVPDHKSVEIKLAYPAGYLPDDQLRHFFYPFTTEEADTNLVELPLVPVIVHKHSGTIGVGREGEDLVTVTVTLPVGGPRPAGSDQAARNRQPEE